MNKRKGKATSSNEQRNKIPKYTEDGLLSIYEAPMALKDMAATKVTIALWYHQNLRNLLKKDGYNGPWYHGESSEEDEDDCSSNEYEVSDESTDHYSDSSNEPEDLMEDKRVYQSYYDCYREEHENDFSWDYLQRRVTSDIKKLPVPPATRSIIQTYIEPVKKNFKKWVVYNHKRIFINNHLNYVYGLVDEVIWQCDGQVDFEETARNLLSSPRISEIEKYRLICTYCLEDEMKNVSPRLFGKKYIEKVTFGGQPMVYYWNSYATGNTIKIPRGDFKSINSRMLATKHADNKSAIRYFWNRLTDEEKLECGKKLIHRFGVKRQNFVLTHLNGVHQHHILLEMGVHIIENYARKSSMSKYAVPIWKYLQNILNALEFAKIIVHLLNFAWDYYNEKCDRTYVITLIRNLWQNTSKEVKNFVLDYEQRKIINFLMKGNNRPRTKYDAQRGIPVIRTNVEETFMLLCDVLSDADANLREEVLQTQNWLTYHEYFTKKGETELLEYFIRSCLPRSDEKANELRRNMLNTEESTTRCLNLLKQKKVDELDKFLSSYLPDTRSIADYKTELMLSKKGIATFAQTFSIDSYKSLHTSVNKIIEQKDAAVEFKRKIIVSVTPQFCEWIEKGRFANVLDCLKLFLSDENDVKTVKETLLRSYQGEQIFKVFAHCDETQWQEFVLWCLGNEQNISQFKESLPFDSLFTHFLQHSIFTHYDSNSSKCKFRNECNFTELDRFLRWFFVASDQVKKFKINRVLDYRKIDVINMLSRKKDDTVLKSVLNWFFAGDDEGIRLFKAKYKKLKIATVI